MNKEILVILATHEKARFLHVDHLFHVRELEKEAFSVEMSEYSDKPGRTFESASITRHAMEPSTDKKEKLRNKMAIELNKKLKFIKLKNNFNSFYLFTESKLEKAFKKHCSKGLLSFLNKVVHKNYINEKLSQIWGKIRDDLQYEKSS